MTNFSIVCGVYKYKSVKALLRNLLNLEISWQVFGVTLLTTGLEPSTKSFGTFKRIKKKKQKSNDSQKKCLQFPFLFDFLVFFYWEASHLFDEDARCRKHSDWITICLIISLWCFVNLCSSAAHNHCGSSSPTRTNGIGYIHTLAKTLVTSLATMP